MVVGKPVRIWAGWEFLVSFCSPFLWEQLGVAHLRIVWLHRAEFKEQCGNYSSPDHWLCSLISYVGIFGRTPAKTSPLFLQHACNLHYFPGLFHAYVGCKGVTKEFSQLFISVLFIQFGEMFALISQFSVYLFPSPEIAWDPALDFLLWMLISIVAQDIIIFTAVWDWVDLPLWHMTKPI